MDSLLPASALVREKERGTVEQLLVSPVTPFQIMWSKVLAMSAVILIATALAVYGVLHPIFHVPMKGDFLTDAAGTLPTEPGEIALCVREGLARIARG